MITGILLLFVVAALALIAHGRDRLDTRGLDLDRCRCFVSHDAGPPGATKEHR